MPSGTDAAWWKRLLFALGAMILTLVVLIGMVVLRDYIQGQDVRWTNWGEIQVVGYGLIFGGIIFLVVYVLLVVPLVLLWSVQSQRRRGYVLLCVLALWPVLFRGIMEWKRPAVFVGEICGSPASLVVPELFAMCFFGLYFGLICWKDARRRRPTL